MESQIPIQTTKKIFDIVDILVERDGARFTTLVDDTGIPQSTLYDHLQTMVALGLLVKHDKEYRVSTQFLEIGETIRHQSQVYQAGHKEIKQLAEETGEHASLMIEENGQGVLLDVQKGEQAVDINAYPGRRLPLPPLAPGKAILAHLPEERIETILDEHGLPRYTDKTITNREKLYEELERVRERGYATDDEELIDGIKAFAVPILGQDTVWGAVTIGGPTNRMQNEEFEQELLDLLMEATNVIELNLVVHS